MAQTQVQVFGIGIENLLESVSRFFFKRNFLPLNRGRKNGNILRPPERQGINCARPFPNPWGEPSLSLCPSHNLIDKLPG
jgi:hypothetical protein